MAFDNERAYVAERLRAALGTTPDADVPAVTTAVALETEAGGLWPFQQHRTGTVSVTSTSSFGTVETPAQKAELTDPLAVAAFDVAQGAVILGAAMVGAAGTLLLDPTVDEESAPMLLATGAVGAVIIGGGLAGGLALGSSIDETVTARLSDLLDEALRQHAPALASAAAARSQERLVRTDTPPVAPDDPPRPSVAPAETASPSAAPLVDPPPAQVVAIADAPPEPVTPVEDETHAAVAPLADPATPAVAAGAQPIASAAVVVAANGPVPPPVPTSTAAPPEVDHPQSPRMEEPPAAPAPEGITPATALFAGGVATAALGVVAATGAGLLTASSAAVLGDRGSSRPAKDRASADYTLFSAIALGGLGVTVVGSGGIAASLLME